jgi:nitrous oxide reductase accessory protein NosL
MMDRSARGFRAALVLAITTSLALVAVAADDVTPRAPGPRDACRVCGMFVAPHPEWLAQIVADDGTTLFFDGCKDLFTYLLDPDRFGAPVPDDRVAAVFVTSYYDQTAMPARQALFVAGSDVYGPMGAELVPLSDREEAEEFMRDHNGAAIFRFEDIDATVVASLH